MFDIDFHENENLYHQVERGDGPLEPEPVSAKMGDPGPRNDAIVEQRNCQQQCRQKNFQEREREELLERAAIRICQAILKEHSIRQCR